MDYVEKSFASAAEASKLLITLSTALVAFCAAVVNAKSTEATLFTPVAPTHKWTLALSWLCLLAAVGAGIWTQLAITDQLANSKADAPGSVWSRKITFPFTAQLITFMFGVIGLTLYAIVRLFG